MNNSTSDIAYRLIETRMNAGFKKPKDVAKNLFEKNGFKKCKNLDSVVQYVKQIESDLWGRINNTKTEETKRKISNYLTCIGVNPEDNEELLEKIDEKITGFFNWYKENYIK